MCGDGCEQQQMCCNENCPEPVKSLKFVKITESTSAGPHNVDWTPAVNMVLCESCYVNFRRFGTLERPRKKRITDDMKVCFYKDCKNPRGAKHYFHINKDKPPKAGRNGPKDWTSVHDKVLCKACYLRFQDSETLERKVPPKVPKEEEKCTYEKCLKPDQSSGGFRQISPDTVRRRPGGQDWGKILGQPHNITVLCKACYQRYFRKGSLEVTDGRRQGQGKRKRSEGPAVEDDGGEGRAAKASASGVVVQMLATPVMQGEPVSASAVVVTAVTAVDMSAVEAQRGGQQGTCAPGVEAVHVTPAAASAAAAAAASPIHQSSSSSKGGAGVSVGKGGGAPGAGQTSRLVDAARLGD